ncbi:MAG TPA: signal peptidase II [Ruminococcaceae bacterium]|nr:signal peptidase II [Oscillospiraceae bacterium]
MITVGEVMVLAIILAVAAGLVGIDQLIKYFIVENLAPDGHVSVIDHVLSLVYVENRGVAFGMFQNHVWLFAVITLLLMGAMIWLILSKRITGKLFYVSCMLIMGGGIGNLIDRMFRGFVVDYLSLSFFPPVCNFADYCVTIGAVLLVAALLQGDRKAKSVPADVPAADTDGESHGA